MAPILLSRAPLFSLKAQLFPQSTFVLGVDTAQRVLETRFYGHRYENMLAALADLHARGCNFLVAGRLQDERFMTLADLELPPAFQSMFSAIPEDKFRVDISSTEIRAGKKA